jgi:hypothetical protein
MQLAQQILDLLMAYKGAVSGVVGFIFMLIVKRVSNEKAGPVVSKMQVLCDKVAKGCELLGKMALYMSQLLADLVKSDGILGKE